MKKREIKAAGHSTPAVLLSLALLLGVVQCNPNKATTDLLIYGGKIYTMTDTVSDGINGENSEENTTVEALLVRDGRIVFAGSKDGAVSRGSVKARHIDLAGAIAIPGLIDAHGHIEGTGRLISQLDLVGTKSKDEIREKALGAISSAPKNSWIQGRGWDQNDWKNIEYPTFADLEGTESHPVYLRRIDGHACWVNKRTMEICGIDSQSEDPDGGKIVRDAQGAPTGIFIDNAVDLIASYVDEPTVVERRMWIVKGIEECNRLGLVGMHDAGVDSVELAIFRALANDSALTLRVYAMLSSTETDLVESYFASGPTTEAEGYVTVRSIKVYADGALGSRGALLLEPYSDEPNHSGLMITSPDSIQALTERALASGFQTCTHAIGDRGVRGALDAYEKALNKSGARNRDARLRIEHSQVISLADIPRFAELGVIPSMQPTHATSDMYWAEDRVGPERIAGSYSWRKLLNSGVRIPFGSDSPAENVNPLWGVYAAVTRQDHKGWPENGWRPEEKLAVFEAVRGFTVDAAYAEFAENDRGTLVIGKIADITILDKDIFNIPPKEILSTRALYTIVAGKIVYAAK